MRFKVSKSFHIVPNAYLFKIKLNSELIQIFKINNINNLIFTIFQKISLDELELSSLFFIKGINTVCDLFSPLSN